MKLELDFFTISNSIDLLTRSIESTFKLDLNHKNTIALLQEIECFKKDTSKFNADEQAKLNEKLKNVLEILLSISRSKTLFLNQALRDYLSNGFHTTQKIKDKMKWKINVFRNAATSSKPLKDEEITFILMEIEALKQEISTLKLEDQREIAGDLCFVYYILFADNQESENRADFISLALNLPLSFSKENEMHNILRENGAEKYPEEKVTQAFLLASAEEEMIDFFYFYIPQRDCIFGSHLEDPFNNTLSFLGLEHRVNIDKSYFKSFGEGFLADRQCVSYVQSKIDEFRKNRIM